MAHTASCFAPNVSAAQHQPSRRLLPPINQSYVIHRVAANDQLRLASTRDAAAPITRCSSLQTAQRPALPPARGTGVGHRTTMIAALESMETTQRERRIREAASLKQVRTERHALRRAEIYALNMLFKAQDEAEWEQFLSRRKAKKMRRADRLFSEAVANAQRDLAFD